MSRPGPNKAASERSTEPRNRSKDGIRARCSHRSTSTRRSRSRAASAWRAPAHPRLSGPPCRPGPFPCGQLQTWSWNDLLVFIFFFVVGRAIIVMAGLAGLAGGQRLRLQPGLVLFQRDIVELGSFRLRRLAQLLEIVVLLPDGRQGI